MQQEEDQLSINVMLAGRSYRIRVQAAKEGAVRKAVKRADEQIKELRRQYAGKDEQDFVAMCLLMYAAKEGASETAIAEDKLAELLQKVTRAIGSD